MGNGDEFLENETFLIPGTKVYKGKVLRSKSELSTVVYYMDQQGTAAERTASCFNLRSPETLLSHELYLTLP